MLIRCANIFKSFRAGRRRIEVLKGCSIAVDEGETVVLFGESGCGKTTLGRVLLMLVKPDAGRVFFKDTEITAPTREFRKRAQLIPQNPDEALNPRWRIYDSIAEPLRVHGLVDSGNEEFNAVAAIAEKVGLKEEHLHRKPSELSGGELQRAVIARALILEPEFVVCDEPTSMLDVSVQASIVRTLMDIQKRTGVSYLFITHDLELARAIADRMYVMSGGRVIGELRKEELRGLSRESLIRCELPRASVRF